MINIKLIATSLTTALLIGCVSSTEYGPGAKRAQLMIVSQELMVNKANHTIEDDFKREKGVYWSSEERLVNILNSLIPYADQFNTKSEPIEWNVNHWYAKQFNAGALANGTILITDRMVSNKLITDADLAYVMAHEMAHVIRQHHREMATWKYVVQPTVLATGLATAGLTSTVSLSGRDLYSVGFNKALEKEADELGMVIYASAGYDPENALVLFEKVEPIIKKEKPLASRIPSLISTHPSFSTREKRVKENMERYKEIQKAHTPMSSENLIVYKKFSDLQKLKELSKITFTKDDEIKVNINIDTAPNVARQ